MNVMRGGFLLFASFLVNFAFAADPAPEFSAAGVVRGAQSTPILVPGEGLSIYGSHLGPFPACSAANPDPKLRETVNPRNPDPNFANLSVYPKELCGVQVLIGDKAAGLLYVSGEQINFKVPQDSAETGAVELRVVSQGQSSAPLRMPAGFEKTTVSLAEPAYTNMPLWLKVETRFGLGHVTYPSLLGPAGFGCHGVEVRRDGKPLPVLPGSNWMRYGMGYSGPPCGSYGPLNGRSLDRLPLHLLYRFDVPGVYEVRYTLRTEARETPRSQIRAQSEWTTIEILPSAPNQRRDFLNALRQRSASANEAELLSDVLPSALGLPDDASFDIVTGYLYNPSSSVRRYAMNGLSYWPEDATSAKLLALLKTKGPSDELVRFLTRQRDYGPAHQAEIVAASLPYLESDSAIAIEGALTDLQSLAAVSDPAVLNALLRAADHIAARADVQNRSNMFQMLAAAKDERVHALLRKFADAGDQLASRPLASFADPDDLPRLGALLAAPMQTDLLAPELLYKTFGTAAVPYLETALRSSSGRTVDQYIAVQLMAAGDAVGFQFAVRAIATKGAPHSYMLQALKNQFPELKAADDDAIASFIKARAGN